MCEIKFSFGCYRFADSIVSVENKRSNELVRRVLITKKMSKKIIIIGSGAAGFAAASKLISNGFENVVILEAENRLGGRVHTIPYGENVLDMGAQW